jgi:hypothetical protein
MIGSNLLKKAMCWSLTLVCFLSIASATVSFGGYAEIADKKSISKIVSVLAIKSPDGKILGKAAEKLSAMSNRDLRLISSLCDRISADDGTAGADIAFSLITAMIVLS